jgi:hypothetical protein
VAYPAPLRLAAVWSLSSWGDAVLLPLLLLLLLLSLQVFWGGDGPNDTGLSRKHIIEGTKVTAYLAVAFNSYGLQTWHQNMRNTL